MSMRSFSSRKRTVIWSRIAISLIVFLCAVSPFLSASIAYAQSTQNTNNQGGITVKSFEEYAACLKYVQGAVPCIWIKATSSNASCDITDIFNAACWGRWLGAIVTTLFIGIAGKTLGVVGVLFNWILDATVVNFSTQLYTPIKQGIEIVWTFFRDFSNIIIIGMFTFIAINIILGVQNFGNRRLIANVLIVAVLINFSLLFSRVVIEGSNFIAGQFHKAALAQVSGISTTELSTRTTSETTLGGQLANQFDQKGIAGQFIQLLGLTTVFNTFSQTLDLAKDLNSGWLAVFYGLLTASLIMAAAGVLLYASFLLMVRTILFIILMAISALAFASWLVPKQLIGERYGFFAWWQALLKNAVFAPILLMFLWATLQIGKSFPVSSRGSLAGLLGKPDGGSITALFFYLLILGMLYASVRISNMFAAKVGGLSVAGFLPSLGLGLLARGGGFAARQTVGRLSARTSESIADAARYQKAQGRTFFANQLDSLSQGIKKGALRDFNAANTRAFSDMTSRQAAQFGRTNIGGFVGGEKKAGAAANERAQRLAPTEKEAGVIRNELAKTTSGYTSEIKRLEEDHSRTQKELATLTTSIHEMAQDRHSIEKDIATLDSERSRLVSETGAPKSEAAKDRIDEINREIGQKQGELSEQRQKIEAANKRAADFVVRSRDIRAKRDEFKAKIEDAAQTVLKNSGVTLKGESRDQRARAIAPDVALNRLSNAPFVMAGLSTKETDRLARGMDEIVKELRGQTAVRDLAVHIKSLEDKTVYGQREQLKQTKESVKQQEKVSALIEHQTDTVEKSNRNRPTT